MEKIFNTLSLVLFTVIISTGCGSSKRHAQDSTAVEGPALEEPKVLENDFEKEQTVPVTDPHAGITEDMLAECTEHAQCIIVPHNHCCGLTKRAINAELKAAYDAHPKWQKYDGDNCAFMAPCFPDDDVTEARCEGGHCLPLYP